MISEQRTPVLPRGALKLAAEALEDAGADQTDDWASARIALTAALPAIERAALKRAALHMLALREFSYGRLCPACHGKPVSAPHAREGRTGYKCGCGHEWEPPKHPGSSTDTGGLLRKLARGEPLPELPDRTRFR